MSRRPTKSASSPAPRSAAASPAPRSAAASRVAAGDRTDIGALLDSAAAHRAAGRLDAALRHFRLAYAHAPAHPAVAGGLGTLLRDLGRAPEAVRILSDAVRDHPGSAALIATLASALQASGDLKEAVNRYREALKLDPSLLPARANLGLALTELGALDEAIAAYRAVLAKLPDNAELHCNLGWALFASGEVENARRYFERAVLLNPGVALAQEKLGLVRLAERDLKGAAEALARDAEASRGPGWTAAEREAGRPINDRTSTPGLGMVSAYKLAHEADQLRHLHAMGMIGAEGNALASHYDALAAEFESRLGRDAVIPVEGQIAARLGPAYGAPYYMPPCPTLSRGALNTQLDFDAIESAYLAGRPEAVTIDGLLRGEALEALRAFCHTATMWNDVKRGYMGAYLRHGFGAPLLLQIAAELRDALPGVLGPYPLIEMWAYKYDQALNGIETHADCAAVNVNFWLAPDDANLDPASGGLEVFLAEAPASWDFHRYNTDGEAIDLFLEASGHRSQVVPHRSNRAVLFNSNLFHRTHDPRFKPGYTNRRINVTMLFGFRKTNAA